MFAKIWYLKINDTVEGPYSVQQLRHHPKVTPDTLAQKKGWNQWLAIRAIFELRAVFEDTEPLVIQSTPKICIEPLGEAVLDLKGEFPFFYFWILLVLCLLLFFFYWEMSSK